MSIDQYLGAWLPDLGHQRRRIILALLFTFCLGLGSAPACADAELLDVGPTGGPPLLSLGAGLASPSESRVRAAGQEPADEHSLFLPLVQRNHGDVPGNPPGRQAVADLYLTQYLTTQVAMGWTGNHDTCDPGTTSESFRAAVLQRINYFRTMAGVPAGIVFSAESNRKAQAAALMMSVNRDLSHDPPTNWTCYSTDGAEGAGSANLHYGGRAGEAVIGYMKDAGDNNSAVGHRRWILYPQTQMMGTGDIPRTGSYPLSNALWVFDSHTWETRPPTREPFVAWPPSGYVPYQVVFPRWSFSYLDADFSKAIVTIVSDGASLPISQAPVVDGYGENTLVWIPNGMHHRDEWPHPGTDTPYSVTIRNVMIDGQIRDFTYDVVVFDPTP